jgi:4-hydroxybenzoate polyprenyltransferase
VFLKHIGYIKTIITGLLAVLPFTLVLHFYHPPVNDYLFLLAILLSTIGKELLMDVRDIKGDLAFNQKTFATKFGSSTTQMLSIGISLISLIFYALSYQVEPYVNSILVTLSALIIVTSYIIWFSKKHMKRELGIYLLWGGIIICSLPVLI